MKQTPTIEPIEVPDVVSTLIDSYAEEMAKSMFKSLDYTSWDLSDRTSELEVISFWKRLKRKFYQRIYDWVVTKDIDTPDYW